MKKELKRKRVFINPIYKDRVTVLKSADETGGVYSLGELEVLPGGGNTLHTHSAFEETFTAIKGRLGVVFKGEKVYLQPGESFTIPKFTPHHFFNPDKETITCHVKFVPAHEGFEKGLAIAYGLASDGKSNSKGAPKNIMHLALLLHLTDTHPVGMAKLFMPLFRWLGKRASRNGMEKELLDKYYYE